MERLQIAILLRCQFFLNYRFNSIKIKILSVFYFVKIGKMILKFIWIHKQTRKAKTILKKQMTYITDYEMYYKGTVLKRA